MTSEERRAKVLAVQAKQRSAPKLRPPPPKLGAPRTRAELEAMVSRLEMLSETLAAERRRVPGRLA